MGIVVHRGGLPSPSTSLNPASAATDCASYARLYPDAGVKAYERAATAYHEPKSTYDHHLTRPVWVNEAAKYPAADHPNKAYDATAKSYAEAKCHEVAKYHHEMTSTKYHEMATGGTKYHHEPAKYPDLQAKAYDLPKYPDKGYPDSLKGHPTEMSGAAKASYACVHGQYYPTAAAVAAAAAAAEGYAVHEENDYQPQGVSTHSFYPYISASMAQPPYYMGPR